MQCPNCLSQVPDDSKICPNCKLEVGQVANSRQSASLREPLHKWVLGGAVGTLIVSIIGAFTGGDGSVLGILGILLAVTTLYFTRFGRTWDNLAGFPKLIAYPCVAFGIFYGRRSNIRSCLWASISAWDLAEVSGSEPLYVELLEEAMTTFANRLLKCQYPR